MEGSRPNDNMPILDDWVDGEEVKQLDEEMRGVMNRVREVFTQAIVVHLPRARPKIGRWRIRRLSW